MELETQNPPAQTEPDITEYPTSDGLPMGETPVHRKTMVELIELLEERYKNDPNVYVSGNMLLYYERGNKRKHVSPDVQVTFGIPRDKHRDSYFVWEEGKGPDVVFEITSLSTHGEDMKWKYDLYLDLKVSEYFLYDPRREYLEEHVVGYRRVNSEFEPIRPVNGRWESRILGMVMECHERKLRLFDSETGEPILLRAEIARMQAERDRTRADQAEQRAAAAEAENETLKQELKRLREGK